MSTSLLAVEAALARRESLVAGLVLEGTDCYRLFHGTVEGWPGVTVDRYGDVLLVQSFHTELAPGELAAIEAACRAAHPVFTEVVYNDRSAPHSRVRNAAPAADVAAESSQVIYEHGVAYEFRARHRGQDPWLFLDLRAARRHVKTIAAGKSLLNLFAYTCGVGTCAAVAGAVDVLNVDFARSSLDVGRANAALNGVTERSRFLECDFFPAARQLAGLGMPRARRQQALPPVPRLEPASFDVVFLDPPRYAKSAFGVVDLVNDYGGVFKPALLATREGGTLICCNNVAQVDANAWVDAMRGAVRRNRRTLHGVTMIRPEADFPSRDDNPPLKVAVLSV